MPAAETLVARYVNTGHVLTHMVTILYATAVLHLPAEFGFPYGEMLGYAGLGLILYGVAALPAGWIADRWSQAGMMIVFFLGIGFSSIYVGMADNKLNLIVGLSLLGTFAAIYHPVGIAWLIASCDRQGISMGINGFFGALGSALAAPFVGMMIDYASWRFAFVIPGIASLLIGLALWSCWKSGSVVDAKADRVASEPLETVAIRRAFIVLTLTMACAGFVYAGLTNTMPKIFEIGLDGQFATSYTQLGLYVGAVIGLSSLFGLVGGWMADRFSPRVTYIVFWLLAILPLFAIPSTGNSSLLSLMLIALSFITGFAAAENMLVARFTPFEWRSVAYGSKFVLTLGIGGLTVHLAGYLFDSTGSFDRMYLLLGMAAALATMSALLLPADRLGPTVADPVVGETA